MNINIELGDTSGQDEEIFNHTMKKYGKTAKLVGVRYVKDGNFTIAQVAIRPLINSRYGGTLLSVGASKRNPSDPPFSVKGRAIALNRAIKRVIHSL